jgi:hypothetical protein
MPGGRRLLAFAALAAVVVAGCDRTDWRALHREVVPEGRADRQEIRWRLDLDAARDESRETGRPLFFWAMNGHPCGCT